MTEEARTRTLANACDLMSERFGRELAARLEAQRRQEEELRETERAILQMSAILPQSTCSALRRMASLQSAILQSSEDIAKLRQTVIKWTARRNMLASRASVMQTLEERRRIEEEIFEALGRGKSEASS